MKITIRGIRISILTLLLLMAVHHTYRERMDSQEWKSPLVMVMYPINQVGDPAVSEYIASLSEKNFNDIQSFVENQARLYSVTAMPPVKVVMGPEIKSLPPERQPTDNFLQTLWWTLHLRYWAYQNTPKYDTAFPVIRMYLVYHPLAYNVPVPHSSGLQKGLLGAVHLFAADIQQQQNNVVVAHEFLHTVGATDKYDFSNNQPLVPIGLGDRFQNPLYPQQKAELMAGHLALSATENVMPDSLETCTIGPETAAEIGWQTP